MLDTRYSIDITKLPKKTGVYEEGFLDSWNEAPPLMIEIAAFLRRCDLVANIIKDKRGEYFITIFGTSIRIDA